MKREDQALAGIFLLIAIVIAYAYIAAAFEEHTVWASIIFGFIVVVLVFALVRFPAFRSLTVDAVKRVARLIGGAFTSGQHAEKDRKRAYIPQETERLVFRRADNRCQVPTCGKLHHLRIHHIDGDRTNPHRDNLILLCSEHHADADHGAFRKEQLIAWRDMPGSQHVSS